MGKKVSVVKSHLRVDIAGGTLDLWPLYHFVGQALTLNAGLSLTAMAEVNIAKASLVKVEISNLNYNRVFKTIDELLLCKDSELDILSPVLKVYNLKKVKNLEITLQSQSPVGGGLGGSSTLLIALLKSFDQEFKIDRSEEQYVTLASGLESAILRTPAGTQDYYQAITPGLSKINYDFTGRSREFFKSPWLEKNKKDFVLIYSGQPHHSGLNNWRIFQNAVNKDANTLRILQGLKDVADGIFAELQTTEASRFSELLQMELDLRTQLATGYVNEALNICIKTLKENNISHFKICGAGGGGCLWAFIPEDQRKKINLTSVAQMIPCELVL